MRTPERVIWDPRTPEEQTAGVQAALRRLDAQRAQQKLVEAPVVDIKAATRAAAESTARARGRKYIPHLNDK